MSIFLFKLAIIIWMSEMGFDYSQRGYLKLLFILQLQVQIIKFIHQS